MGWGGEMGSSASQQVHLIGCRFSVQVREAQDLVQLPGGYRCAWVRRELLSSLLHTPSLRAVQGGSCVLFAFSAEARQFLLSVGRILNSLTKDVSAGPKLLADFTLNFLTGFSFEKYWDPIQRIEQKMQF